MGMLVKQFISFKRPHHSVTTKILERWCKQVVKDGGIDTNSTREVAPSAATLKCVCLAEMNKAAA